MFSFFDNRSPKEIYEIANVKLSGKPVITYDDILDFFIDLIKLEKRIKRQRSKKISKDRRLVKNNVRFRKVY